MEISSITPLILTYNEAPNIGAVLARLHWAQRILLVDSFSTDQTIELASRIPSVRIVQRKFDSFAQQCNFGLSHIDTEWVLSLDADYLLTTELSDELRALAPAEDVAGYSAKFRYCINGKPLRATLYPARTVLYRRGLASYINDGHAHRVQVSGKINSLRGRLLHDDRKPLTRWVWSQDRYAKQEAEKLTRTPAAALGLNDRIRKTIVLGPPVVLCYTLFVRGVILDGWAGWFYALQRALAETLLSLRLLEVKLARPEPETKASDSTAASR